MELKHHLKPLADYDVSGRQLNVRVWLCGSGSGALVKPALSRFLVASQEQARILSSWTAVLPAFSRKTFGDGNW